MIVKCAGRDGYLSFFWDGWISRSCASADAAMTNTFTERKESNHSSYIRGHAHSLQIVISGEWGIFTVHACMLTHTLEMFQKNACLTFCC
jgi:hypothetical protein